MNEDILKYLDGEMTDQEKENFETLLKNNKSLKEEYDIVIAAKKVSGRFIDAEIKGYLGKLKNGQQKKASDNTKINWIGILIVGLFILGLVTYLFLYDKVESKLSNKQYAIKYEEPAWPLERGSNDSLSLAISLHLSGRTEEGLKILLSKKDDLVYKYWAAEILVYEARCGEAKEILNDLVLKNIEKQRVEMMMDICKTK